MHLKFPLQQMMKLQVGVKVSGFVCRFFNLSQPNVDLVVFLVVILWLMTLFCRSGVTFFFFGSRVLVF